jgi:hypothetical protein
VITRDQTRSHTCAPHRRRCSLRRGAHRRRDLRVERDERFVRSALVISSADKAVELGRGSAAGGNRRRGSH